MTIPNNINDEVTQEYYVKYRFIQNIGRNIREVNPGVEKCEFKLFARIYEGKLVYQEYLVITFRGGAISCRNININSNMANLREIARMVDGGYYDEVKEYQEIKDSWAHCEFMTDGSIVLIYRDRLGE